METRQKAVNESDQTQGALKHLRVFALALAVFACVPYLSRDLEDYRLWVPGDPAPFTNLYAFQSGDSITIAGTGYQAASSSADRLAEDLGESVASNLERDPPRRAPRKKPSTPEESEEAAIAALTIEDDEVSGISHFIEDPDGRGLAPFYQALIRTARAEDEFITRIAHYGDSSIATDLITHTMRRHLQERFGDAGHGFLLFASGHLPYRHRDVYAWDNGNFFVREVTRGTVGDGHYGYGGNQIVPQQGALARLSADPSAPVGDKVSRFEIWYQKHRRGGRFRYRVDGGEYTVVDTRSEELEDAVEIIELPEESEARLEIRAFGGRVHFYGGVVERDGPGVVYDSLGLVGARANRLLNFDAEHIRSQLERRGVHLLILGFGGNESSDNISGERYEEQVREVIRHIRGDREDLGCLLMAPLDQGEVDSRGRVRTIPTVPTIVAAQRRAAFAEGCAFFDTFEAMGGEGAMRAWSRSRPRLALSDYRHATPAGYEVIGNLFYKALLHDFRERLPLVQASVPRKSEAQQIAPEPKAPEALAPGEGTEPPGSSEIEE